MDHPLVFLETSGCPLLRGPICFLFCLLFLSLLLYIPLERFGFISSFVSYFSSSQIVSGLVFPVQSLNSSSFSFTTNPLAFIYISFNPSLVLGLFLPVVGQIYSLATFDVPWFLPSDCILYFSLTLPLISLL